MNYRKRRIQYYYIFFGILFIGMGIVYSILQANLQINGTTKIANNTWDVHFANIQVTPGSVLIGQDDSAATIDSNNPLKIDFSVTLSLPGDFYEFTVDAVNAGTVDAMIGSLDKTLTINNSVVTEIPDYLIYTVTYVDDIEILENHLLAKNTTETYKVRVEFKADIDSEDLPNDEQEIDFSLETVYIQSSEGVPVPHPPGLYDILASNAVRDDISSDYVESETGINYSAISSDTNGKGVYLKTSTENDTYPVYFYRGDINNNNVLFANFCWKIVRTTDTGGVKLIYNGLPTNGECLNTTGNSTIIQNSKFNTSLRSFSDAGFMYGVTYPSQRADDSQNWYFGSDVSYENGLYTLISRENYEVKQFTVPSLDYYKYTCGSTTEITCENIKYVYKLSNYTSDGVTTYPVTYFQLSNGKKIEDALEEMLDNSTNEHNSSIKTVIDNWYQENLIDYTSFFEDTVWCNDRRYSVGNTVWNPNGGTDRYGGLSFKAYYSKDLTCPRVNDSFTVSSANGNGNLTYPIGLLTTAEYYLSGAAYSTKNSNFYLHNEVPTWTMTPFLYNTDEFNGTDFGISVMIAHSNSMMYYTYGVDGSYGVRPAISLKHSIKPDSGDGTPTNPYVIIEE